jgi:hypothetical protein
LGNWVRQAREEAAGAQSAEERAELKELRRELERVTRERDLLAKASMPAGRAPLGDVIVVGPLVDVGTDGAVKPVSSPRVGAGWVCGSVPAAESYRYTVDPARVFDRGEHTPGYSDTWAGTLARNPLFGAHNVSVQRSSPETSERPRSSW